MNQWAVAAVGVGGVGIIIMIIALASRSYDSGHPTSASYRYGYDLMTSDSRDVIAKVNAQLRIEGKAPVDSPAQLLGPHGEDIGPTCDSYLQIIDSGINLLEGRQLPPDFSSADFLRGCNDGGKAMLAAGH